MRWLTPSPAGPPLLLLAAAALLVAPSSASPPRKERAPKAASWDEVNVLAHGLLQLGHGLKEHVERTRGQMRQLAELLGAHNASISSLERSAGEQRQQLARAQRLLDGRVAEVAARLAARERLDGAENTSGSDRAPELGALQNLMGRQNLRIEELFRKVKQQQFRMDKQSLQIKSLQSKVNLLLPLHIKENEMQGLKWKLDSPESAGPAAGQGPNSSLEATDPLPFPVGCYQLALEGEQNSGVFWIRPPGSQEFEVLCDMTPGNGGWTVVQRRRDGSADFDQLWEAYRNGFGNMSGDFWLGLEKMHQIMKDGRFHLLIELQDWEGNSKVVQFLFSLGGEDTAYTLSLLGPLLGELENAMGDFPQLPFSTRDRDHDLKGDANCAKHLSGGWWFSTCGHVNLNGKFFRSIPRQRHERKQGIFWKTWRGRYYPLRSTTMKIRPVEPGMAS